MGAFIKERTEELRQEDHHICCQRSLKVCPMGQGALRIGWHVGIVGTVFRYIMFKKK